MRNVCRISTILFCVFAIASACAQQKAASVYKTNCTPCHGVSGDANTPAGKKLEVPPFRSSDAFKKSDAQLLDFIKSGKGQMPAWGEVLSDDEVKDVILYIRAMQKAGNHGETAEANHSDSIGPKR